MPRDVVVGLAHEFDGILVPVSAVPYAYPIAYTIKPMGSIYIVWQDMVAGQVIPSLILSSGKQVVFQGSQVNARVTENNVGRFSVAMTGSGLTTAGYVRSPSPLVSYLHVLSL
jgi:hypothetical protein